MAGFGVVSCQEDYAHRKEGESYGFGGGIALPSPMERTARHGGPRYSVSSAEHDVPSPLVREGRVEGPTGPNTPQPNPPPQGRRETEVSPQVMCIRRSDCERVADALGRGDSQLYERHDHHRPVA